MKRLMNPWLKTRFGVGGKTAIAILGNVCGL